MAKISQEDIDRLPNKAAKKQAEAVNKLEDQYNEAKKAEENPDVKPVETDQEADPQPTEPKPETKADESETKEPEGTKPEVEKEPSKETKPEKTEQAKKEDWEQKYKTLQGMHKSLKSQVDANMAQLNALQTENTNLRSQMSAVQTQTKQTIKQGPAQTPFNTNNLPKETLDRLDDSGFSQEDIQNFMSLIGAPIMQQVNQTNDVVQKMAGMLAQNQEADFWDMFNKKYPNATDLDAHPDFEAFGNEKIPYTNVTKIERLHQAAKELDFDTVSQFYDDFIKLISTNGDRTPEPPPPVVKQPVVEPGPGRSETPKPKGPTFKRSELQSLYNRAARLKVNPLTQAEGDKLYKEIDLAQKEGRLI